MKKKRRIETSLPLRANRILNGILVALVLIAIRVWHLAVIQHDEKIKSSKKPQERVVIERGSRSLICDRFGLCLAQNHIQYNACVVYGPIREVQRWVWGTNEEGKRVKVFKRKNYITKLSQFLGKTLSLNAERVEDLIHARAALLGNVPLTLKENIDEVTYFKLKMLEKQWPGLHVERVAHRHYPYGPLGSSVVGYIGAITSGEYEKIIDEMRTWRTLLAKAEEGEEVLIPPPFSTLEDVGERLSVLESKAYTIHDKVGKSGAEKAFDEQLRPFCGVKRYLAAPKGNFLCELPGGYPAKEGSHVNLTISKQLQEYAEKLLAEYEKTACEEQASSHQKWEFFPHKQPWIKGGAIVAMDPKTGEILALASHPRFDPSDYVSGSKQQLMRWLENDTYLGQLWDEKEFLRRELYDAKKECFYEESLKLSWENYLSLILPKQAPLWKALKRVNTIEEALAFQKKCEALFAFLGSDKALDVVYSGKEHKGTGRQITLPEKEHFAARIHEAPETFAALTGALAPYFSSLPYNSDKALLFDLISLVIDTKMWTPPLTTAFGRESLASYKALQASTVILKDFLQQEMRRLFHEGHFKKWRDEKFADYLAKKREEEEERKLRARSYLDYLDEAEKCLFHKFWECHSWDVVCFVLAGQLPQDPALISYLPYIKVLEKKASLAWPEHFERLKKMGAKYDTPLFLSYLKTSRSFEQLTKPLVSRLSQLRHKEGVALQKHLAAAFYPKQGFGYARSCAYGEAAYVGSVFKLIPAYEALRQRYTTGQSKGRSDLNPLTIIDDKRKKGEGWDVGFTLDQRPIPRYYHGGKLPRSDHSGIGRVDLIKALAVSSNPYFAILSGDVINDPEDVLRAARLFSYGEKTGIDLPGEIAGHLPEDLAYNKTGLYSFSIGQHSLVGTPLQTAVMLSAIANGGEVLKPHVMLNAPTTIKRTIFLPPELREVLLKGLEQVILSDKGTARMLQGQFSHEELRSIVGKTSTAEAMEKVSLDAATQLVKVTHIAFGAIAFDPQSKHPWQNPELVVVVYLRFGYYGKEAAPYAVRMIQKWREIKKERVHIR